MYKFLCFIVYWNSTNTFGRCFWIYILFCIYFICTTFFYVQWVNSYQFLLKVLCILLEIKKTEKYIRKLLEIRATSTTTRINWELNSDKVFPRNILYFLFLLWIYCAWILNSLKLNLSNWLDFKLKHFANYVIWFLIMRMLWINWSLIEVVGLEMWLIVFF